ncbi:hypothetical protein ACS0TY_029135 [Phlomoides rotata]
MARILKQTYLYISLAILFTCLNETADCFSTSSTCNGTAEHCRIATDEAEFLIEETAEIMRRVLASRTPISYDAMNKNKDYCNSVVYGSCIGLESKYYKDRPCNYQNLCNRDT